uniref:Uncharacterized protein n=1 Tax=Romanomermis culicivorax TaxID=13658 RepID=A0A915JJL7_ROMCU
MDSIQISIRSDQDKPVKFVTEISNGQRKLDRTTMSTASHTQTQMVSKIGGENGQRCHGGNS